MNKIKHVSKKTPVVQHHTATGYLILYQRRDAPILGLGFVQSLLFQTSEAGHGQCSMSGGQERTDWAMKVCISPLTYVNSVTLVLHTTDLRVETTTGFIEKI